MTHTLVVVGHGMVGHRLVEALAERDKASTWRIVVLAEEPRPAYDRIQLSSYFTGSTAEDLSLCSKEFLDHHGIELHLGDPAVSVDRGSNTVTARSGKMHRYDALVFATGSYPFVPPVPGRDASGCFVYRTIEDLQAIEKFAANARVGAVVGGGLLGLEAANALISLGLETHIVEFSPRLMPLQVDPAGGKILRKHVEGLGLIIHTEHRTDAIECDENGRVRSMRFAAPDGSTAPDNLDVDLVIFSAGIRPRDQLARECGLPVGERGGIIVDEQCRTADERIYAIGECALAADGKVYGLVAPGYEMAQTVAEHLLGNESRFTGADTSTKLKLLGVDVASFGDAFGNTPQSFEVLYADAVGGVYKKLIVTEDNRLLGGMLVGDASLYSSLRPLLNSSTPLPVSAEKLLLPPSDGAATMKTDGLPDDAIVCSCHNVPKAAIKAAVREKGCTDIGAVKNCTKASTGCGSCLKLTQDILNAELAACGIEVMPKGLCEHLNYSRAALFDIIKVKQITTFSELLAQHGSGEGCEICKPVVASILASLSNGYILDGEQAALQDTNDHFLANIQRNGSYSVVPRIPGGEITPEKLIVIGEIARDFGLYTKITGGQRIDMFGARVEQLPQIWKRLVDAGFESGHAYGKALRTIKSCVGSTWCRYGVQDSVSLAIELELRYRGLRAPHKIKSAVSACARECAEARSKDFGIIATEVGWNLYVGGNGGFTPRHADLLASDLDKETLIRTIDRFLMFYIKTADRLERTAAWIQKMEGGLDYLRSVIIDDALNICDELDALLCRHVANYKDEWRATLEDPERLRRFVSFVNAPDVPDASIQFVSEREQIRPILEGVAI